MCEEENEEVPEEVMVAKKKKQLQIKELLELFHNIKSVKNKMM